MVRGVRIYERHYDIINTTTGLTQLIFILDVDLEQSLTLAISYI